MSDAFSAKKNLYLSEEAAAETAKFSNRPTTACTGNEAKCMSFD